MKRRPGFIKITLLVSMLLVATVVVSSVWVRSSNNDSAKIGIGALTFSVFRGEFVSSVNEAGDIESSNNVEIRCRVKSRGRSGVTILEIIPEGTKVVAGDFLCQLDDSLLVEELMERKIMVAKDKATLLEASSELSAAEQRRIEYDSGLMSQEVAELEAAINVAKENVKRTGDISQHSTSLHRKGFLTLARLKADDFAAETAIVELHLAEARLNIYNKFTQKRITAELKSEIEQLTARQDAAQFTLDLSIQRQTEYEKQVASCRVVAPQDGVIVYANESNRRETSVIIEEGALIRDGQPIFFLPDPTKMQVNAKINDSKINKIEPGQRVEVRVDTAPEVPVAGVVRRVSSFPLPRRYYQAPIEYEVFVDITESSPLIRGGLRGKVEIFVETQADVIQTPVSSLVLRGDQYFVIVKTVSGIEPRAIEIGSNNEKYVVVTKGLEPGENVLVDADNYRDKIEFPSSP